MTALALDVRELTFDEVEFVSGGSRVVRVAMWFARLVRDGVAWEVAKKAAEALADMPVQEQDPYTLAKIG